MGCGAIDSTTSAFPTCTCLTTSNLPHVNASSDEHNETSIKQKLPPGRSRRTNQANQFHGVQYRRFSLHFPPHDRGSVKEGKYNPEAETNERCWEGGQVFLYSRGPADRPYLGPVYSAFDRLWYSCPPAGPALELHMQAAEPSGWTGHCLPKCAYLPASH